MIFLAEFRLTNPFCTDKRLINPSERFFGDMAPLSEPIDTSLFAVRNCDVPLLDVEVQHFYLEALRSPEGVPHEVFWRLFDKCDCDQYFTKSYLHSIHGPTCLDWQRGMGVLASQRLTARNRRPAFLHSPATPSPLRCKPCSEFATPPTHTLALTAPSTPLPSSSVSVVQPPSVFTTPTQGASGPSPSASDPQYEVNDATADDVTTSSSVSDEDFEKLLASLSEDPTFGGV